MSTAPQPAFENPFHQELQQLRDHWLLLLIFGVVLVLLGTLAIISSFIATLVTVTFFGALLFVAAIFQVINAVTCRNWRGFTICLLNGILFGVVGMIMMNHPVAAAAGMTILLAAAFIVGGTIRIVISIVERFHSWPWVMLNGFINLFLGIYIWRLFPESAFWVIGLFIGIDLIFGGWSWIFLALSVRGATHKSA